MDAFRRYFWAQWMGALSGWYEGYSGHRPSTNNGLEAINRTIKDSHTLRDRLPLPRFLGKAIGIVKAWSSELGEDPIKSEKTITLQMWTKAWQWSQDTPTLHSITVGGFQPIFIKPSTSKDSLQEFKVKVDIYVGALHSGTFRTWEVYKNTRMSVWMATMYGGVIKCTCPSFVKKGQCKHTLGIKILTGQVNVPVQAQAIPLGRARKRGRPSRATAALVRD